MDSRAIRDIELRQIADEIGNDTATLGLHLGFSWSRSQAYQNNRPLWPANGTMEMLHSWRSMQRKRNQRQELVRCLVEAGLIELADRVENGEFVQASTPANPSKWSWWWDSWPIKYILTFGAMACLLLVIHCRFLCLNLLLIPSEIQDLRRHLVQYYDSTLCNTTVVPWNSSNLIDYDDLIINLYHIYDYEDGDTLERKRISPSEVFQLEDNNGRIPKRILLRGAAGAGKTTVTCKIAHDWGSCLRGFSIRCKPLLIILQFRLINPTNTLGQEVLDQGLVPINQRDLITPEMIDDYMSHNPENAIIILDGYDEFVEGSIQDETTKGILDIVRVRSFNDTTVIVTTRTWLIHHFDPFIEDYIHVEITGFTAENVEVYVKKFFQENEAKAAELLEWFYGDRLQNKTGNNIEADTGLCDEYYLNCKIENVQYVTKYPQYLPIICEIWKQDNSLEEVHDLPELFDVILGYMYDHYRHRLEAEQIDEIIQLDELRFFLGKTAYEGLWGQSRDNQYEKTVFSENEFSSESIFKLASEIGILTSSPRHGFLLEKHTSRKVHTTEFFHKFIQEYLASWYMIYLQNVAPERYGKALKTIKESLNISLYTFFLLAQNMINMNNKYTIVFNENRNEVVREINQYDEIGVGGRAYC